MKVQSVPRVNAYIATAEDTAAIHKLNIKKGVEQELLVVVKREEKITPGDTILSSFIVHFELKSDTGR